MAHIPNTTKNTVGTQREGTIFACLFTLHFLVASGTKISPLEVKNEAGTAKSEWVCGCGHSKSKYVTSFNSTPHSHPHSSHAYYCMRTFSLLYRPFCDGTHSKLHAIPVTATPAATTTTTSATVSVLKAYLPYISGAVVVAAVAVFAIKKYQSSQ